jgi:hypothetical protein
MHHRAWLLTLSLVVLTLAGACGQKAQPSGDRPSPRADAGPGDASAPRPDDPMRQRPDVTIRPGGPGDLGDQKVVADGMTVWPPTGPGCEPLVACCRAAAGLDRAMGLACQLSVARTPVDCGKALAMVRRLMGERMMAVPAACAMP